MQLLFSGTDAGGGVTFRCSFGGGPFTHCASPRLYWDMAEGSYTFEVAAVDGAGNVDATTAKRTFQVDNTPPTTTLLAKPALISNQTAPTFDFSGNGTGSSLSSFRCTLDGAALPPCDPGPVPVSGESQHTFTVAAVDQAGNVDPTPESWIWTLDSVAPTTALLTQPPLVTTERSAAFRRSTRCTCTAVAVHL